ncbi:hypothetical protein B2J93_7607 [Marssonina coronariae]|uniref:Uncharacterized protein n=1 Tax=Diplocarpon coronariae TaxID=2795749 RepID=A0A218Z6A0_9HELO|nr:hypothetical protein B2J93_7607 [Marssonina coronariae]
MAAKGHSGDSIVAHEELNLDELYQKPKQIDSISDSIGERVALDHYRKFQMEEHGNSVDISKLTHHMLREQRETLASLNSVVINFCSLLRANISVFLGLIQDASVSWDDLRSLGIYSFIWEAASPTDLTILLCISADTIPRISKTSA